MLTLKNIIGGSKKKKRLNGVITTKEAKEAFDKYYSTQKTYLGKVFDMMYQKEDDAILTPCDKPEFVGCRKKKPNKDGKGNTCLDVAQKVCPKESFGSAKYTGTKKGPQRFDIYGVDAFPEGESFKVTDNNGVKKTYISKGLPKAKDGRLNKNIAKKQYKKRQDKGEKHIIKKRWDDYKKNNVNSCKSYRKNKSPECNTIDGCEWISAVGCRKRKNKETIRKEKKEIILEISDDEEEYELEETSCKEAEEEEIVWFKYEDLIGIKNLPKYTGKKIYIDYHEDSDNIYVYLCDDTKDKIKFIGALNPLTKDVDKKDFKEDKGGRDKLEDYITNYKDVSPPAIEFIPKQQIGGNIRLQFTIDTRSGEILNGDKIIGSFKNSSFTIF